MHIQDQTNQPTRHTPFYCLSHLIWKMINCTAYSVLQAVSRDFGNSSTTQKHTHSSCLIAHRAVNNVNTLFSERQPWPEGQTVLLITLIMSMPICWRAESTAINNSWVRNVLRTVGQGSQARPKSLILRQPHRLIQAFEPDKKRYKHAAEMKKYYGLWAIALEGKHSCQENAAFNRPHRCGN